MATKHIILRIDGDATDVDAAINDITGHAALTAERTSTEIDQPEIGERGVWATTGMAYGTAVAEAGVGVALIGQLERVRLANSTTTEALSVLEAIVVEILADIRAVREGR